ncbi:hypothetical protein GLS40_08580 [Pseudooceanicola sp. 216_PA32_1]|uniref:Thiolase N-terminal domain-containing protein n=1 Tax=Pseudooceanicola pacificus TaxID=2676438 RepID=A0A844W4S8_9RHOB|nr:hypothetical protein [Pseudooceanicola pacificus]
MRHPVIVDALRTPMGRGKQGGCLSALHPSDLLGQVLKALVERNGIDPARVDDVLIGCVSQVGEQSATPGRWALLAAGFPASVPSTTIDRKCGSGQQAVHFAAQASDISRRHAHRAGAPEYPRRLALGLAPATGHPSAPGVDRRMQAPGCRSPGPGSRIRRARPTGSRGPCRAARSCGPSGHWGRRPRGSRRSRRCGPELCRSQAATCTVRSMPRGPASRPWRAR